VLNVRKQYVRLFVSKTVQTEYNVKEGKQKTDRTGK